MIQPFTLAGTFVRLEPLGPEHLDALAAAAAGPRETYAFTFVPADRAGMAAYMASALTDRQAGRGVPFATVDARSGRVLGSTRYRDLEYWSWPAGSVHTAPPGLPDALEIGSTWLTASAQRTPINSEAKLLMLAHAFETWSVKRVTLKTDERNVRSRAAIERLGAKLDGVLRAHMAGADDAVRDTAWYSILAEEWPTVRARGENVSRPPLRACGPWAAASSSSRAHPRGAGCSGARAPAGLSSNRHAPLAHAGRRHPVPPLREARRGSQEHRLGAPRRLPRQGQVRHDERR
jgi:RimJ/RimL family protein N-acetyltransferase